MRQESGLELKYYLHKDESQSWEKGYAVEKAGKWERSKGLSFKIYPESKPKKKARKAERTILVMKRATESSFQNDRMTVTKLNKGTTGKTVKIHYIFP